MVTESEIEPETQETAPAAPQPAAGSAEGPSDGSTKSGSIVRTEDFTVRLDEVFQGPMDLLLHLVKEQEVEIQDVRLAEVAVSYMNHVRALRDLDIEVAGEYLVIAATLMAIKSRSLLPREEVELEDDLDPQDELIQRLIEYRRFKGASDDLDDRYQRRSLEHERGYRGEVRDNEPERTFELGEVTAWDLLATFSRLMRETAAGRTHHIKSDPRPLRWYVQTIGLAVRASRTGASLRALVNALGDVPTREGIVGSFCALLELMKIGLVTATQERQEDDIVLNWMAGYDDEDDLDDLIRASRFMDEDEEDLDSSLDESETEAANHAAADEALAALDRGPEEYEVDSDGDQDDEPEAGLESSPEGDPVSPVDDASAMDPETEPAQADPEDAPGGDAGPT